MSELIRFNWQPGIELKVVLHTGEEYTGNFVKCTQNKVVLEDVRNNKNHQFGLQRYDKRDFFSIEKSQLDSSSDEEDCPLDEDELDSPYNLDLWSAKFKKEINDERKEVAREMDNPIQVIEKDFLKSFQKLKCTDVIAVQIFSEKDVPRLLIIACMTVVYIYQSILFNDNQFIDEIKSIFEDPWIEKIIHGINSFLNLLKTFCKTEVNNVFDTQFYDHYLMKESILRLEESIIKNSDTEGDRSTCIAEAMASLKLDSAIASGSKSDDDQHQSTKCGIEPTLLSEIVPYRSLTECLSVYCNVGDNILIELTDIKLPTNNSVPSLISRQLAEMTMFLMPLKRILEDLLMSSYEFKERSEYALNRTRDLSPVSSSQVTEKDIEDEIRNEKHLSRRRQRKR